MNKKTQMEKLIHTGYRNIAGLIVIKDGDIKYQTYQNDCSESTTLHIFSVTKSILSILIGIAVDKGMIDSVDQKILDFFPDYRVNEAENPRHVRENIQTAQTTSTMQTNLPTNFQTMPTLQTIQNVTIRDMLTMTVPYQYKKEPYTEYFESKDWVVSALNMVGGKDPIGEFRYAPLIGPDILSGILVRVTHRSVLDFANEYLFGPLGIKVDASVCFKNKEEQLAYYKKKTVSGWVTDPQGTHTAGWGLALTTMDMAKIGQLYLNDGKWAGKQIVSTEWVRQSTTEHSRSKEFRLAYGYLWWLIDQKEHCFAAMGDGGNIIYVNQKKNMVIAISSLFQPKAKDRIKLIREYIEPVFAQ